MHTRATTYRRAGFLRLAAAVVAAVLALAVTGCSKIKEISVTSIGVKYITPVSSRSVEGVLLLGVDNPAMGFTVSNVDGVVHYYDKTMGFLTAGTIPVMARTSQVYELPCTATLAQDVSILDVLAIAARRSLEGATADVTLNISLSNGRRKGIKLKFKNIDLGQEEQQQ